jgi:hypothetical protein
MTSTENSVMNLPIPKDGPKVTSLLWNSLDTQLITGHDNGDIVQWDVR